MPRTPPSDPQRSLCPACGLYDFPIKDRLARPDGVTALPVLICQKCGTVRFDQAKVPGTG